MGGYRHTGRRGPLNHRATRRTDRRVPRSPAVEFPDFKSDNLSSLFSMSRPLPAVRAAKLRRYLASQKKAGKHYAAGKARAAEIIKISPPGTEIEGPDGKVYVVQDNFAARTAFKTCAIDRYELKEKKPEKAPR